MSKKCVNTNCQSAVQEKIFFSDELYCDECGHDLEKKEREKCTHCGYPLYGEGKFCTHCGNKR